MAFWNIGAKQTSGIDIGSVQYDLLARTWISTGSTDLNNSANWTGSGALLTTDNLYFSGVSIIDAAASADLEVNSITVEPGFTGGLAFVGHILTLDGTNLQGYALSCSGTGNRHFGNGLTIKADSATVLLDGGSGNFIGTSCALEWNGLDGTLIDNHLTNFVSWHIVNGLTCTGSLGSRVGVNAVNTTCVSLDSGAYLRNNSAVYYDQYHSNYFIGFGGSNVFNGSGVNIFRAAASSITPQMPPCTYSGTGSLQFTELGTVTNWTSQLTGKLDADSSGDLSIYTSNTGSSGIFDFNGYDATCNNFYPGADNTGSMTIQYRGGNFSWNNYIGGYHNSSANVIQNFSTSRTTCHGDWTFGSNHTIQHTSDTVFFTGDYSSNTLYYILNNGKSFYDATMSVGNSLRTVWSRDPFSARNFSSAVVAGGWSNNGTTMTLSGSGYFSARTHDLGNTVTFTSDNAVARFDSTIVTMDTTTAFVFNGNGAQFNSWNSWIINSLTSLGRDFTCGGDGANGTINIFHSTNTPWLTLSGTNPVFVNNQYIIFNFGTSFANYYPFNFSSGYTFKGSGPVNFVGGTGGVTVNIPADFTYSGTADWTSTLSVSYLTFQGNASFATGFTPNQLRSASTLAFTGNNKTFNISTTDCTNCTVLWTGTGGSIIHNGGNFKALALGTGASLSITTGGSGKYFAGNTTPLIMGNNSSLSTAGSGTGFALTASGVLHSIGTGCSISVPSGAFIFAAAASSIVADFPAFNFPITMSIIGVLLSTPPSGYTVRWTGDTTCTNLNIYASTNAGSDSTFDFNDHNLSIGFLYPGASDGIITLAHYSTINYGNGNLYLGAYDARNYVSGYVHHNFEGCHFYCSTYWAFSSSINSPNVTYYPGTSFVQLIASATGQQIIVDPSGGTTSVNAFNDLEVKCTSSGSYTVSGGPLRVRNLYLTYGGWTTNGYASIISGSLICNTPGAINNPGNIYFTGNSTRAYFDSTCGSGLGSPPIFWQGLDGTWTDNKGVTAGPLAISDGSSLNIAYGTAQTIFSAAATPQLFTLKPNSRLTVNSPVLFYSLITSDSNRWDTTAPYTFNGTAPIDCRLYYGPNVNCPGLNYSGTGLWRFLFGPTNDVVVGFYGDMTFGGSMAMSSYSANSYGKINFAGSISFPNNDSTFSINDNPGDTLTYTYDGSNCTLIFNGKRCCFQDNNLKYTSAVPYKTFKKLLLTAGAQVTNNGSYPTIFQSTDTPLRLDATSSLSLGTNLNLYQAASGIPYSIASDATISGTGGALTISPFSYYGGYQPYGYTFEAGYGNRDYFVDINADYTSTGTGNQNSPYNYTQFMSFATVGYETFRLRGSRDLGSAVFSKTIGAGVAYYVRAWDLSLYGPWRIATTNTMTLDCASYAGSIEDGIICTGTISLTARKVTNCYIKSTTSTQFNTSNTAEVDGCTIIGPSALSVPVGRVTMQDCIVDLPIGTGLGIIFNNCVFTRASFAGSTFNNCQFSWNRPTWPVYASANWEFDRSLLNYDTMTTPPKFGANYPNYWGSKNNPWTYPSDGFGGVRQDIGFYYNASSTSGGNVMALSLPSLNFKGTSGNGVFQIRDVGRHSNTVVYQTGHLNLGANSCEIYSATRQASAVGPTDSTWSIDCVQNGAYDFTCGDLKIGSDSTNGIFNVYWGMGNHYVSSYDGGTHNSPGGNFTEYFQKSYWRCAGTWLSGTNHIHNFIPGNSMVSMIPRDRSRVGSSNIYPNGKYFNFLEINSVDQTVTIQNPLKCHGFNIASGYVNTLSMSRLQITGDYQTITEE